MDSEKALLSAREIVRYACEMELLPDGYPMVDFPFRTYNESTGETIIWQYDDLVNLFKDIIEHYYGEPSDESVPFQSY